MPGRPGPKSVAEVGRSFSSSSVALQQGLILSEFPKKPSSKIELQLLPWDSYSSPCWLPPVTEHSLRIFSCSSDALSDRHLIPPHLLYSHLVTVDHFSTIS